MYRKILEAELVQAEHMSDDAFDCCKQMLTRDPTKRLGANGAREVRPRPGPLPPLPLPLTPSARPGPQIMAHPFFAPIDWERLLAKELEPPFKPEVKGKEDVGNVDRTFLREPAAVTPTMPGVQIMGKEAFQDFTYQHANVLDGQTYSVSDETGHYLRDGK